MVRHQHHEEAVRGKIAIRSMTGFRCQNVVDQLNMPVMEILRITPQYT